MASCYFAMCGYEPDKASLTERALASECGRAPSIAARKTQWLAVAKMFQELRAAHVTGIFRSPSMPPSANQRLEGTPDERRGPIP